MTSSSFYLVLVVNGPPGWDGDKNHGISGIGIGRTSRERELRGLSVKRCLWDSQALSLPVAICSEKHKMQPYQLILSFGRNRYPSLDCH